MDELRAEDFVVFLVYHDLSEVCERISILVEPSHAEHSDVHSFLDKLDLLLFCFFVQFFFACENSLFSHGQQTFILVPTDLCDAFGDEGFLGRSIQLLDDLGGAIFQHRFEVVLRSQAVQHREVW